MKKLTFTLLLLCGLCMAINAQSNQSVDAKELQKAVVTQQNNDLLICQNVVGEKTPEVAKNDIKTVDLKDQKSNGLNDISDLNKKRRGKGTPVWKYIAVGAIVVVVVVLYVVAPNGWNSRTGVQ